MTADDRGDPPPRRSFSAVVSTRRIAAGVLLIVAGVASLLARPETAGVDSGSDRAGAGERSGSTGASSWQTVRLEYWDGREGTLADFRGEPLVVNFFASWCVPCLTELPAFEKVHRETEGRVTFLGVNHEDARADGRRVVRQAGVTFTTLRDPSGLLLREMGGLAMPSTAFVSADGELLHMHSGALTAAELRSRIEEFFG